MRSCNGCVTCGCDGPSVYARRWARSSGQQDHEHPPLTTQGSLCSQYEESLQRRYILVYEEGDVPGDVGLCSCAWDGVTK